MSHLAELDLLIEHLAVSPATPRVGSDLGALVAAPADALSSITGGTAARGGQELATQHLDVPAHACNASAIVASTADGACQWGGKQCQCSTGT